MGQEYSVIYLWEKDKNGHYKVKHPCKVCQAIGRNVIEPVAVFVPKGKEEEYREKLLKIESEDELQKELEELYKDVDWYKKPETYLTCILHCDKENSIWIKNFEEYKEYAKRRDESIRKRKISREDFSIEWDKNPLNSFWNKFLEYLLIVQKKNLKSFDFQNSKFPIFPFYEFDPFYILTALEPPAINPFLFSFYKKTKEFLEFSISFEESIFYDKIYLNWLKFKKEVNFNKAIIHQYMEISFSEIEHLLMKETIVCNDFKILNSFIKNLSIEKTWFSENSHIFLSAINNLTLTDLQIPHQCNFCIANSSKLKNFSLENVYNLGNFSFKDLQLSQSSYVKNSSLENTKFINCNFSEAKQIEIEDSDLTEAKFINTNWGEISEKRICKKLFKENPEKAREVYRQLKYVLDQQADYITANQFYALEMKAYERYLKQQSWKTHFQEKFIFHIHKWISDFGLSWIKPLMLLIFTTLIVSLFGSFQKKEGTLALTCFSEITLYGFFLSIIFNYLLLIELPFKFYKKDKHGKSKEENQTKDNKKDKQDKENELDKFEEQVREFLNSIGEKYIWNAIFWISVIVFMVLVQLKGFGGALDHIAETLNIFKTFKGTAENGQHFAGFKFIYTLYVIFGAVLIYQMIVAIRRRVKR